MAAIYAAGVSSKGPPSSDLGLMKECAVVGLARGDLNDHDGVPGRSPGLFVLPLPKVRLSKPLGACPGKAVAQIAACVGIDRISVRGKKRTGEEGWCSIHWLELRPVDFATQDCLRVLD